MKEIIEYISNHWNVGLGIFALTNVFFEITPIKFNPISAFLKWIGDKVNKDLKEKLDIQNNKLDKLETKQEETELRLDNIDLNNKRSRILDFSNSSMHDRNHTKEEFDYILRQYKEYEEIIGERKLCNGQLDQAIKFINDLYYQNMKNDSFLK